MASGGCSASLLCSVTMLHAKNTVEEDIKMKGIVLQRVLGRGRTGGQGKPDVVVQSVHTTTFGT